MANAPSSGFRACLFHPAVDALCVGGASILFLAPILLSGQDRILPASLGLQAWLTALINMPHFLASYRMVYRNPTMIRKHPWAAIRVPAILGTWAVLGIALAENHPHILTTLSMTGSIYLAWHYTGQVWGMMAVYSSLGGLRYEDRERRYIRLSLRMLLAWHVTWYAYHGNESEFIRAIIEPIYSALTLTTIVAAVLGLLGLVMATRRTGRLPHPNAWLAWGAVFVWYAAMARDASAIFWVQMAHAIQYLVFPLRVEANRTRQAAGSRQPWKKQVGLFLAVLLGVSAFASLVIPDAGVNILSRFTGTEVANAFPLALLGFLNIHHYFTDGCIWKLRDPEVRRDLFGK